VNIENNECQEAAREEENAEPSHIVVVDVGADQK
jgi:hypothetical protein